MTEIGGGIMRWTRRIHEAYFPRSQTCCSILVSDLLEAWLYLPAPEEGGLASSSFKDAVSSGGSTSEAGDSVFAVIPGRESTLESPKLLPRHWLRPEQFPVYHCWAGVPLLPRYNLSWTAPVV